MRRNTMGARGRTARRWAGGLVLGLAMAACGGDTASERPGAIQTASATDLSDAELTVYKTPT